MDAKNELMAAVATYRCFTIHIKVEWQFFSTAVAARQSLHNGYGECSKQQREDDLREG